ncbi:MAG: glycosyl hydrolase, partial [Omnitrophica WOR_2 bacterium]
CVHPLPDGRWRMWYKDEAHRSLIYYAESMNLVNWFPYGAAIFDRPQEGPNVFVFQQDWWMVTDPWNGLGVYRSTDAGTTWRRQENILSRPGLRADDGALAHHADVLVSGGRAFIFYHTHPGEQSGSQAAYPGDILPFSQRRSSIQAAELHVVDGKLTCDRDESFDFSLVPPED